MNRQKQQKKELFRRLFVYSLMTVTVITLLVVLTLTILGYRFNFSTQTVEQTGLVQFDSTPRGATVSIDGKVRETTQTKNMVLPGQHQFSIKLKGYENWQKTLDIEPGTVTWLSYIRLVPTEKVVESVKSFNQLGSVLASPDRAYAAGITAGDDGAPQIAMMDFRSSRQPKVTEVALDTSVLSGYDEDSTFEHHFTVSEWSDSSRYLLVRHDYKQADQSAQTEWLWLDRDALASSLVNLSSLTNLSLSTVRLTDDKKVYVLQDTGDVRSVSTSDGTISRPLLSSVTWFDVYDGNTLMYTGTQANQQIAGAWRSDWQQPTVLTTLVEGDAQSLHIQIGEYYHKTTVAVSVGDKVTIYRGTLPGTDEARAALMQTSYSFTLNRPVAQLNISDNGRFVTAEDATGMVVYDLERLSVSQEIKKYASSAVRWLDGYYTWQVDGEGQLQMEDFDGVNSYQLMPMSTGFDVVLTQDGKYIYGFVKNEAGAVELVQLAMTI